MPRVRSEFIEDSLITALYMAEKKRDYKQEKSELKQQLSKLRDSLSDKEQRLMLFRLEDCYDLVVAAEAERRYVLGFRRGIQLMTESLYFRD